MTRRLLLGSWERVQAALVFAALVASAATTPTGAATPLGEAGGAVQAKRSASSGVYTEEQARRGEAAYQRACSSCHLDDMYGDGVARPLAGSEFYARWGDHSVADLMETRTSMPMDGERLSPEVYADIIAYMLKFNKLPAGSVELPADTSDLQHIVIERPAARP